MTADRPRRKDLAFMVSLVAVLALVVLSCLSFAVALDRLDAHRTITGLQAAQAQSTATTACVRLYAVARDEARDARDTALADAIVVAVAGGSPTAAIGVYETANAAAKTAANAYGDYLKNPVLPCPITG